MNRLLFVPPLGTRIRLTEPWTFPLYQESRNYDAWFLFANEEIDRWNWSRRDSNIPTTVTLEVGTVLNIERIYIRSGASGFDSITFRVIDGPNKKLLPKKAGGTAGVKCRFWAKLADINDKIVFEEVK